MFYSFKELKQQSVDSLTKEKKMSTSQIVMKCQKKNIQIVLKMKPAETIMSVLDRPLVVIESTTAQPPSRNKICGPFLSLF